MQVLAATVVTEDVAFYAQWQKAGGGEDKGEAVPYADAASVYDGCLYGGERVVGLLQVTIAKGKVEKKTGAFYAKVTATVQVAGLSKKLNFRGTSATGTVMEMTDKNGDKLAVLSARVDSARHSGVPGTSRPTKSVGQGTRLSGSRLRIRLRRVRRCGSTREYNVAFDGGMLSVSVDKKGKTKIAGSIKGIMASATSQLVVGKDAAAVPVVITKKVMSVGDGGWEGRCPRS